MRKCLHITVAILIVAILIVSFVFAEPQLDHITDASGLLSDNEFEHLERLASDVENTYSIGIYFIAVNDWHRYANDEYVKDAAHTIYDEYDLGIGGRKEGILLFLSMSGRDYAIIPVGELANRVFNDSGLDAVEEQFLDNFKVNDWYGGIKDYINGAASVLEKRLETAVKIQNNLDSGNVLYSGGRTPAVNLAIIFGIPGIVAIITVCIFAIGMRNAKVKTTAGEYVRKDTIQFSAREDRFIRRTETRTKIERSSSGGGGGGSSGHSGKF